MRAGKRLRDVIKSARKDPQRWGKRGGLTQTEAAAKVGISHVWWRQIETGYTDKANPYTIGDMCTMLGISIAQVRSLGEKTVADAMEGVDMVRTNTIPNHIINERATQEQTEAHIRATPGLSEKEAEGLIELIRMSRGREEPLGRDIWQRH
jgi:transcriptional regulator with XRE-family HTH domain